VPDVLEAIPIGSVLLATCAVLAVVPFRRPRSLATASWILGNFPNELPFVFLVVVVLPNLAPLAGEMTARDLVSLALTAVMVVALVVVLRRSLRARAVVERALDEGLGDRWPSSPDPCGPGPFDRRRRWPAILLMPWPLRPRDVGVEADIPYGERGTDQCLDVYRHRAAAGPAPTLVHLHGGRFRWGRKSRESRALLFRLARRGWTCISAEYHRSATPAEGFPTHLVDVKRLLAWARSDGRAHGVDPDAIVLSGSSAGAHLTAMAALTAGDPRFQPGFEDADTSIAAGIGLGGYYGRLGGSDDVGSSPLDHRGTAPPFLVVHGGQDTNTPAEGARRLVAHLRAQPAGVAAYAELPGGQHAFDLFTSLRFEAVVDGIESFTAWVVAPRAAMGERPDRG
jgi:acetyl esterase/lipase